MVSVFGPCNEKTYSRGFKQFGFNPDNMTFHVQLYRGSEQQVVDQRLFSNYTIIVCKFSHCCYMVVNYRTISYQSKSS